MSIANLDKYVPIVLHEISDDFSFNKATSREIFHEIWRCVGSLFIRFLDESTLYNLLSTNWVRWNICVKDDKRLTHYFFHDVNDCLQRSSNLSKFWAWQVMKSRDAYSILHSVIIKLDVKTDYYAIQNAIETKDTSNLISKLGHHQTSDNTKNEGDEFKDDKKMDISNKHIENIGFEGFDINIDNTREERRLGYVILYLLNRHYSNLGHKAYLDSKRHARSKVLLFCNKYTNCEPVWGSRCKINHLNMTDMYHFIFDKEYLKQFEKEINLICIENLFNSSNSNTNKLKLKGKTKRKKSPLLKINGKSNTVYFGMSLDHSVETVLENYSKNRKLKQTKNKAKTATGDVTILSSKGREKEKESKEEEENEFFGDYVYKGEFYVFNEWNDKVNGNKNDASSWIRDILKIQMKRLRLLMKESEFELEIAKMVRQVETWLGGWRNDTYLQNMVYQKPSVVWLSPKFWFALVLNHKVKVQRKYLHLFAVLSDRYVIALRLQL